MNRLRTGISGWRYRPRTVKSVDIPGVGEIRVALHCLTDRYISEVIERGEIYSGLLSSLLREVLNGGGTFLDIGANLGWFSVLGSRLVGDTGRVFSIEPDPFNLRLLRTNLRLNGCRNVEVFPVAAGSRRRRATLYRSPDNQGDHQLALGYPGRNGVMVRVSTVDRLLASRPLAIDFIKIDTQGSEAAILQGMSATLVRNGLTPIVLEFWPHGLENCGSSAEELVRILGHMDGELWCIHEDDTTESVTPDRLIELARTALAPETMRHADIAVVPAGHRMTRFLETRQRQRA